MFGQDNFSDLSRLIYNNVTVKAFMSKISSPDLTLDKYYGIPTNVQLIQKVYAAHLPLIDGK